MTRTEIKHGKLIGRVDDEFWFLDDLFKYEFEGAQPSGLNFQGAVGTIIRPIGFEEYNEVTNIENAKEDLREVWVERAKEGYTDQSLEDFTQSAIESEGDELFFDFSYYEYWEQIRALGYTEEMSPVMNCIGGGRVFSQFKSLAEAHTFFDEIYDEDLLKQIIEYETGDEND